MRCIFLIRVNVYIATDLVLDDIASAERSTLVSCTQQLLDHGMPD